MKPKTKRMLNVTAAFVCVALGIGLIINTFNENIVFYITPTEFLTCTKCEKQFRLGGFIKQGSMTKLAPHKIRFTVTDFENETTVYYEGIVPNLFQEGQGAICLGHKLPNGDFQATEILAKHDENYIPREIADDLKAKGMWKLPGGQ